MASVVRAPGRLFRGHHPDAVPGLGRVCPQLLAAVDVLVRMTPAGEMLPHPLDKKVHLAVARAVAETAIKQGIARAEFVPYVEG